MNFGSDRKENDGQKFFVLESAKYVCLFSEYCRKRAV